MTIFLSEPLTYTWLLLVASLVFVLATIVITSKDENIIYYSSMVKDAKNEIKSSSLNFLIGVQDEVAFSENKVKIFEEIIATYKHNYRLWKIISYLSGLSVLASIATNLPKVNITFGDYYSNVPMIYIYPLSYIFILYSMSIGLRSLSIKFVEVVQR